MKKKEVPQDKGSLSAANFKELCYAVDEKGEYTTALSSGWEPKTIALDNALQEIEDRVTNAKEDVLNELSSPIAYYMELHKMDMSILSSYVGFWKWRIKKHLKPSVFQKLKTKTLQKYADVFSISIEDLKQIPS